MRKTLLVTVSLLVLVTMNSVAQDRSSFKAGINAGLPVGDASEVSDFSIGLDVAYHWGVSEWLDAGLATGFINVFGKTETISEGPITVTTDFENFQFIPLASSFRIYPTYHFKFGADVGYGVAVDAESDGGFYVRPSVGYNITGNTELNVSYINISNDGNFSIATLGILFLF
ncbi:hypothetical protein GTQ34_14875 [Muricauda sp. JGD-17]|uniref:Outer membrane protein beta-barrel domain-containing protein n=1 Tax=Flagellimonas ochracea TaxID=2696472 RepID=A0A964TE00_9FLAO|nr:outer membrane beta-barrel protein [Allomuricauda ochracea]NAY93195.1 hypothetical protein [Allomuricauda ochracea]